MLACIRGATTQTGLQVAAFPVEEAYARGVKVTDKVMQSLNLIRHAAYPNRNDTINPRKDNDGQRYVADMRRASREDSFTG